MKHLLILLITLTLNASLKERVCNQYTIFVMSQFALLKDEPHDYKHKKRILALKQTMEVAFDDCYENSHTRRQKWFRDKYVKVSELYNDMID